MNVYLDYAATSPLDDEVFAGMAPYLKGEFGNPDSLHAYGRRAAYALSQARDRVAHTLGVKPSEVYFTSGGTEADNWAARGIARGGEKNGICVSPIEHAALLGSVSRYRKDAVVCRAGEDGAVTEEHVAEALDRAPRTGLVCVMAVNNETGCIQPLEEISRLCRARGIYLFSDCVQAAGALDLKRLCALCDAAALSGHKIYGPKGTGVLVVKKGVPLAPLIAGGEQERGLRGGTSNVAGAVGFSLSLERAQRDREEFARRTGALRDLFESTLLAALGGEIAVDGKNRVPNISHVTFRKGGEAFLNKLDLHGVAASGGAACSSHSSLPSHVMLAMGRSEEQARSGVRFSFGRDTTEEETLFAARTVIDCY